MLSDTRKRIALFEDPQASSVSNFVRRNIGAKKTTERWCNDIDRGKSTGEKPCHTVTFCTIKLTPTDHMESEGERERETK
jgi:hypothetical protein